MEVTSKPQADRIFQNEVSEWNKCLDRGIERQVEEQAKLRAKGVPFKERLNSLYGFLLKQKKLVQKLRETGVPAKWLPKDEEKIRKLVYHIIAKDVPPFVSESEKNDEIIKYIYGKSTK